MFSSHLDSPFVPIAPVTSPPSPFDRFDCLMGQMINLLGFGNHLKISDQNLKLIIQHCDHILSYNLTETEHCRIVSNIYFWYIGDHIFPLLTVELFPFKQNDRIHFLLQVKLNLHDININ